MTAAKETIAALSAEEAAKFLTDCQTHASEDQARYVYLGIFDDGKLKAAMAWGSPCTPELRARYVVELKSFVTTSAAKKEDFLALVKYYREQFRPSDMVYHEIFAPPEEADFQKESHPEGLSYSWHDGEQSFYTYRITADHSEKYYIGVKRLLKANATLDDCLNDGYWGSGGKNRHNKFKAWKRKHKEDLHKEVLSIHDKRSEAFQEEKRLIGDSWREDKLCLNSRPGGAMSPPSYLEANFQDQCPQHGTVGYIGSACRSCILKKQETQDLCTVHGEVSHFAGHCRACLLAKSLLLKECSSHGTTVFQKNSCLKCKAAVKVSLLECTVHGRTKHQGKTCSLCASSRVFTQQECSAHGITSFVGAQCSKCLHAKAITLQECSVHGLAKHRGTSCFKCARAKTFTIKHCEVHGPVTFQGIHCIRCTRAKAKESRDHL